VQQPQDVIDGDRENLSGGCGILRIVAVKTRLDHL